MTRINVIDPTVLTDQHLMAEYRELPMVMGSLRRSLKSKNGLHKIPDRYTLNAGHVKFFYPLGKFLERRYDALVQELTVRGYSIDPLSRSVDFAVFYDNGLYSDWSPDVQSLQVNVDRVRQRILQKPDWYRYHGKKITTLPDCDRLMNPCVLWTGTSI